MQSARLTVLLSRTVETWARKLSAEVDPDTLGRLVTPAFQDPVHASNRLKPPYSDTPQYKAFVEQFKTSRARPGNPAYRLTEENTAEQLQAVIEAFEQWIDGQGTQAYRGKLDGERHAVEVAAQRNQGRAVALIDREARQRGDRGFERRPPGQREAPDAERRHGGVVGPHREPGRL